MYIKQLEFLFAAQCIHSSVCFKLSLFSFALLIANANLRQLPAAVDNSLQLGSGSRALTLRPLCICIDSAVSARKLPLLLRYVCLPACVQSAAQNEEQQKNKTSCCKKMKSKAVAYMKLFPL